jgi:hypothetical protein
MYLPEFDGFIICRKQQPSTIRCLAPPDFIDLFFYLQTLQVVKLHFKLAIEVSST